MEEFFGSRRLTRNEEVKDAIKHWLTGQAAEVYDKGIKKTHHRIR